MSFRRMRFAFASGSARRRAFVSLNLAFRVKDVRATVDALVGLGGTVLTGGRNAPTAFVGVPQLNRMN